MLFSYASNKDQAYPLANEHHSNNGHFFLNDYRVGEWRTHGNSIHKHYYQFSIFLR